MEQLAIFSVTNNALLPLDDRARQLMAALKPGDKVLVKVHRPRYIEHHRLSMSVLNKLAEAKGVTVETILTWLQVAMGRVDFTKLPNGKVVASRQSIAFASMDQTEFQRWWDEAWRLISEHILPGVDEAVFEEVRQIVGEKNA